MGDVPQDALPTPVDGHHHGATAHPGAADFRSAFDHAPVAMCLTDPHGILLTVNPQMDSLLGRAHGDLVGTTLLAHTHADDQDGAIASWTALAAGPELTSSFDCRLTPVAGPPVPVRVSAAKVLDEAGTTSHLVMHLEDITDHRMLSDSLRLRALHDPLTMLPNRRLLLDRLTHALLRHNRTKQPVTVLYLDLDRFKLVNDNHGHATGDAVLIAIATRLLAVLRTGDTVARLGGDEFVVVCEDTDDAQSVDLARRLRWAVAEPVRLEGRTLSITASIGSATTAGTGVSAADLLHQADTAMYEAKRSGAVRDRAQRS